MKKNIINIKTIMTILITAIIFTSVGVFASSLYNANQITYKDTTVDKALDELHNNLEKKSGELFLELAKSNDFSISHNYLNGYTASFELKNLDFSNIKSFIYKWDVNTNNSDSQKVIFINASTNEELKSSTSTETATLEINGLSNLDFNITASYNGTNKFKVISYTTMDGKVHN